ncbi:hypothetical protein ACWDKQ_25800 [Saccharopolyspora sp. NPDC000995]
MSALIKGGSAQGRVVELIDGWFRRQGPGKAGLGPLPAHHW